MSPESIDMQPFWFKYLHRKVLKSIMALNDVMHCLSRHHETLNVTSQGQINTFHSLSSETKKPVFIPLK